MQKDRDSANMLPSLPSVRDVSNFSHLGTLYDSLAKSSDAESLYTRALTLAEQRFGANHLYTAQNLNNLAIFYESRGK